MLGVDHRWGFAFVSSTSGSADGHDNLRDEGRPIQAPPRQRRRRSPRMMRFSMSCPRPCGHLGGPRPSNQWCRALHRRQVYYHRMPTR